MLPDRPAWTTDFLPQPIRASTLQMGVMTGWDGAIVIPAKDEERRIRRCLDAAGDAIRAATGLRIGIVLVVNNSTDATAVLAAQWAAARRSVPFVLMHHDFAPADAGVGAARRLGLDAACGHMRPQGALMMTDADTVVRRDWVLRNLADLHSADLICGTVLSDPDEARALPAAIASHGSAEAEYLALSVRLVARLDPQEHDPTPGHHNAAGASMAVTRQVYQAVGGLPVLRTREDRVFADRVEAHDYRIRFSCDAVVETSCRLTGRTGGGLAGTLRARASEPDPWADEWLEVPETLALRHGLRWRLRALWPDVRAVQAALDQALGAAQAIRPEALVQPSFFGTFFATVERNTAALARRTLRQSDCRAHLPTLQRILEQTESAPVPAPAPQWLGISQRAGR